VPAVLGDFLAAASEHLEAAVVVGDGQLTELPDVVRGLHRLVAVMSHYLDDLAPCDGVEASTWSDLHAWERVVIDAGEALRAAADCLRRAAAGPGDQASATASWRARHLAAAAANLAAGRDLLHTHRAPDPDGLMRDRSEWAPVVTSLPVTRALADDITWWSSRLAPFTAWLAGSATSYPLPRTPDQAVSAAVRDELVSASQWLHVARAAVRPAADNDPVHTADAELLRAIPAVGMPERHPPGSAGESVAELCDGIAVSAARLRGVIRGSQERARWSPLITSGGWQRMAQAAAVTSHLSELALRSLADRAGQIPGSPATGTQLDNAADHLVGMRTAWQPRVYRQGRSLERAMNDRRVSDPVILLRATAIDNAARRLIIEAENTKSGSGASDAHEGRQPSARGAAELAAQDFPYGPATGPSAGIGHFGPGIPAAPAITPRTGSRAGL